MASDAREWSQAEQERVRRLAVAAVVRGVGQGVAIYPAIGLIITLAGGALVVADSTPFWNRRAKEAIR